MASTSSSSSSSGDRSVGVAVQLGSRPVEIIGHEQDLECPAAPDQTGKPGHGATARHEPGTDLELGPVTLRAAVR
jgi:hypothetical protein